MKRPLRLTLIVLGSIASLLVVLMVSVLLVIQTGWFRDKVRQRIVFEIEKAAGGRAEMGAFSFNWRKLRAEVHELVIHGRESADKPPLFRAGLIAVGIKILSVVRPDVDIDYLDVEKPHVHLILYPDGTTNVPEPKIRRRSEKTVVETILDLAIGRFSLQNGLLAVEGQGQTPFHGTGENLRAKFGYRAVGPEYEGTVSIEPLYFKYGVYEQLPLKADISVTLQKNRLVIGRATLASGRSQIELAGALDDLGSPQGYFRYSASLDLHQMGRVLHLTALQAGRAQTQGNIRFAGASSYTVAGDLNAGDVDVQQGGFRLRQASTRATLKVDGRAIYLGHVRFAGTAFTTAGGKLQPVPVEGTADNIELKQNDLAVNRLRMRALGGTIEANAELKRFNRLSIAGMLRDFDISRILDAAGQQQAPWNGRVSGPFEASLSIQRKDSVEAAAQLTIAPSGAGPPVEGALKVQYSARAGTLQLDSSFLSLPHTTVRLSGDIRQRLNVHFESTNLDDLQPVLGKSETGALKDLPVELRSGRMVFDGMVTGTLTDPQIAGDVAITNFAYDGAVLDSFRADMQASKAGVQVRNAVVREEGLQARFEGSLGLRDWKPTDSSPISASAAIQNARLSDLVTLAGHKDLPLEGTVTAKAQTSGTLGHPQVALDLSAAKGSIYGEPFDRLTAQVNYAGNRVQVQDAQLVAGQKQIHLKAAYAHPPGEFLRGKAEFQVATNEIALSQLELLRKQRPGLDGLLRLTAAGAVDLERSKAGKTGIRIADLKAELAAQGLSLKGEHLGNAHLTANTENSTVKVHLESSIASAALVGDGQWRLSDNYPGALRVQFSQLDFARVQQLVAPTKSPAGARVGGFARGEIELNGPALEPNLWNASLRIPEIEIHPVPLSAVGVQRIPFSLRNSGPIVLEMKNGMATVREARLVGRGTDLTFSGSAGVRQPKNELDLKMKGRIDLATVQELQPDLYSEGTLLADASVRGTLKQPLVNGKLEVNEASFSLRDLPIGVYRANGVIAFNANRATFQSFKAESGGGVITVGGFVGYDRGLDDMVFRLEAQAEHVRVRYPEGVSTIADAKVNWTGTSESSVVAGAVTVLRTGFNPESDFSSILVKSAEPVRTPSARTGILAGMRLAIDIRTSADITFESSLAQDIQFEADLHLRGTATTPALLGRLDITQGELAFFGTNYTIGQGSIAFFNPVRIEPILNIDLQTRARGIDVTITVSGPLNGLNMTPRSDPPLQFNEIVALLATGRAPTSDPSMVAARQSGSSQNWQQMGASALVGQAVASPVAGRLQRFFGITKLKIDPSILGVENNPQARLTVEQQITKDITFTYITDVTSSNPLVVRVEWALNRTWSAIAVRDENGLFGVDFLYKKRF